MRLRLHGGQCCGIKQIHGLGWGNPHDLVPEKYQTDMLKNEANQYLSSEVDFFWLAAPVESAEERLTRYLDFLNEHRPIGVVEIVLSDAQLIGWRPLLLEKGFILSLSAKNGNSGGCIHIFHLLMGQHRDHIAFYYEEDESCDLFEDNNQGDDDD
jgi:hypothetical protein